MVEQVVDLGREAQACLAPPYFLHERHVAGVPRLRMVVDDVLLLVVAFAHVDEAIAQRPCAPREGYDGRSAVPGNVGNLVAVVRVRRVRHVDGLLISVLQLARQRPFVGKGQRAGRSGVHAPDVHPPQVDGRPAELRSLRPRYDFVPHVVVVYVRIEV